MSSVLLHDPLDISYPRPATIISTGTGTVQVDLVEVNKVNFMNFI